jgi:excisionase family DNA binding protein
MDGEMGLDTGMNKEIGKDGDSGALRQPPARKNMSTFAVAKLLEVDPGSVANWIDDGKLKAHRTPGGHRRVLVDDLIKFLREHDMPIPDPLRHVPVRIVVVDDEPAMAQLIVKAIRMSHPEYEVAEAHDGFKAGALVTALQPNVVVLDLRMPGMDGFEVCQQIKSQEQTRHATVIAVTAYPSDDGYGRIIECGAKTCLNKPLDLAALIGHIEQAVDGN